MIKMEQEKNKQKLPVQERIKTFEDACNELGSEHLLVIQWMEWKQIGLDVKSTDAYMKLCIIVSALNEGWEPQFTEDEWRYFPYFVFYTKEEFNNMSEDDRARVVFRSNSNAFAYGGVVYANARYDSLYTYANNGSRIAFRSRKLAEYAGRQFIDIYADFIWK